MLRLIAALLLIPLLDVLLLALVAFPLLGWKVTVLVVVLTALLGMLLVRFEGRRTLKKIQRSLVKGEPPTDELVDGALLIAAGAFFLTPGLVTDAVALILTLPPTRLPVRWALKKWVLVPMADEKTGGFATGNVYIGGFPPDDGPGPTGQGGPGGPGAGGGSVTFGDDGGEPADDSGFDRDDATDIEFEERDE